MNVAILGAGIYGTSIAYSVSRRGHRVAVFDRHPFGHRLGSSHGRSRIIRKGYPDPFYAGIMEAGFPLWTEWESLANSRFVHPTGMLVFGDPQSGGLDEYSAAMTAHGIPCREIESGVEFGMQWEAHESGLFSTDGGWVDADAALQAVRRLAESHGATFESREVDNLVQIEGRYERIVLASGSAIVDFLNAPFEVRVQTICYVDVETKGPVWIEDGPDFLYGFPSEPGMNATKIGIHARGTSWDRKGERPEADLKSLELALDFARRRFAAPNPRIVETTTCLYTMEPNEDFCWGWADDRTMFVSACSGHGFKFAPWIAERIAEAIDDQFDLSSVSRFFRKFEPR